MGRGSRYCKIDTLSVLAACELHHRNGYLNRRRLDCSVKADQQKTTKRAGERWCHRPFSSVSKEKTVMQSGGLCIQSLKNYSICEWWSPNCLLCEGKILI